MWAIGRGLISVLKRSLVCQSGRCPIRPSQKGDDLPEVEAEAWGSGRRVGNISGPYSLKGESSILGYQEAWSVTSREAEA